MKYEKTFSTFIDVVKGVSIGSFVAAMVGYLLQDKENSWLLAISGSIFLVLAMIASIVYDSLREEKNE